MARVARTPRAGRSFALQHPPACASVPRLDLFREERTVGQTALILFLLLATGWPFSPCRTRDPSPSVSDSGRWRCRWSWSSCGGRPRCADGLARQPPRLVPAPTPASAQSKELNALRTSSTGTPPHPRHRSIDAPWPPDPPAEPSCPQPLTISDAAECGGRRARLHAARRYGSDPRRPARRDARGRPVKKAGAALAGALDFVPGRCAMNAAAIASSPRLPSPPLRPLSSRARHRSSVLPPRPISSAWLPPWSDRHQGPLDRLGLTLGPVRSAAGDLRPRRYVVTVAYILTDATLIQFGCGTAACPGAIRRTGLRERHRRDQAGRRGPVAARPWGTRPRSARATRAIVGVTGENEVSATQAASKTSGVHGLLGIPPGAGVHRRAAEPLLRREPAGEHAGRDHRGHIAPPRRSADVNLAIPIEYFLAAKDELFQEGRVKSRPPRPWLGLYTVETPQGLVIAAPRPPARPSTRASSARCDRAAERGKGGEPGGFLPEALENADRRGGQHRRLARGQVPGHRRAHHRPPESPSQPGN